MKREHGKRSTHALYIRQVVRQFLTSRTGAPVRSPWTGRVRTR